MYLLPPFIWNYVIFLFSHHGNPKFSSYLDSLVVRQRSCLKIVMPKNKLIYFPYFLHFVSRQIDKLTKVSRIWVKSLLPSLKLLLQHTQVFRTQIPLCAYCRKVQHTIYWFYAKHLAQLPLSISHRRLQQTSNRLAVSSSNSCPSWSRTLESLSHSSSFNFSSYGKLKVIYSDLE